MHGKGASVMQDTDRRAVDWRRGAGMVICAVAAVAVCWLLFRYVLGVVLPFLLAYGLSRLIRPIVVRICHRRVPRALVAGLLVVLLVGVTVLLGAWGIRRGVREMGDLIGDLTASESGGAVTALNRLFDRVGSVSRHIPLLRRFEDSPGYADFCTRLDSMVAGGVDRLVASVGAALPNAAVTVAGWLPNAFVFVTVLFLSCYYFTADDGRFSVGVRARLALWVPGAWQDRLRPVGRRLSRLGRQYLRAHVTLGFFTFLEVFIGLSVLGVRYAFILAFLIALVDFLPLLGTGMVLIPWGVAALLLGDVKRGVGLLVLYVLCTLIRQLLEPRFIGRGLGLHPLVSLMTMYAGLRFFGVAGMILLPLLCAALATLLPEPRPAEPSLAAQKNNPLDRE